MGMYIVIIHESIQEFLSILRKKYRRCPQSPASCVCFFSPSSNQLYDKYEI